MTASRRSKRTVGLVVALATSVASVTAVVACGSSAPVDSTSNGSDGSTADAITPIVDAPDRMADSAKDAPTSALDAGDSGAPDASDGAASIPPPVCNPDASVGAGTLVISTSDPSILGAVTPDERVIAWTTIPSNGGATVIHWSERGDAGAQFGNVETVDPSLGPFAADHIGLSGDGLRLAFTNPAESRMSELTRTARGTPFATPGYTDFSGVNPTGGSDGDPGLGPFGAPALSPDFSAWGFVNGDAGFVVSQLQSQVWSSPLLPAGLIPPGSGAGTMVPTGWSSDDRTLFYWDEGASLARRAWRNPTGLTFLQTVDLGADERWAYPSGDCSRVYYSPLSDDGGVGSFGIYVAPLQ